MAGKFAGEEYLEMSIKDLHSVEREMWGPTQGFKFNLAEITFLKRELKKSLSQLGSRRRKDKKKSRK